jgi:hypothetical protein
MFVKTLFTAALAGLFLLGSFSWAAPTEEEIAKAKKAVEDKIKELKGERLIFPRHVGDDPVLKAFPNHLFFAAHIRQYPVAVLPVEGSKIKTQNLFIVSKDGKVVHLTAPKELEKFFKDTLAPAKDDTALKLAATAWLALTPEFVQDGFYKFRTVEDATKITPEKTGKKVTGQVVVMQGGNGEINSTLVFDEAGKLAQATDQAKVRAGPRPICQATKLLDSDPIVRKMAEQDLLIMGRAAREYLLQQRAKASPGLQQAIDRIWQRIVEEDR